MQPKFDTGAAENLRRAALLYVPSFWINNTEIARISMAAIKICIKSSFIVH